MGIKQLRERLEDLEDEVDELKGKSSKSHTPPSRRPSPHPSPRPGTRGAPSRAATKQSIQPPPKTPAGPRRPSNHKPNAVQRRSTTQIADSHGVAVGLEGKLKETQAQLKTAETELKSATERIAVFETAGKKFTDLRVGTFLESEKVFNESHVNHDGSLDIREIEKLLLRQGQLLLTDKQLKEVIASMDQDGDSEVDFMEYLAVIEKIQSRRRTTVPDNVRATVEQSKACVIQ